MTRLGPLYKIEKLIRNKSLEKNSTKDVKKDTTTLLEVFIEQLHSLEDSVY